ncbi:MAG: hypothetical protein ACK5ZV_12445 [bacterium]
MTPTAPTSAPTSPTPAPSAPPTPATPAPADATLQGAQFDFTAPPVDDATRIAILEKAFDFRGDVSLVLRDGRTVEGYLFDRRPAPPAPPAPAPTLGIARLLPPVGDQPILVNYADIARISFGKDTAHGKSFETWIKKYVEKKLKGEKASIESEAL